MTLRWTIVIYFDSVVLSCTYTCIDLWVSQYLWLLCCSITMMCEWLQKIIISRHFKYQKYNQTNRDLLAPTFPRFLPSICNHFQFGNVVISYNIHPLSVITTFKRFPPTANFQLGICVFFHCLRTHLFSTSLVRLVILAHFSSSSVHLLMWSLLEDSLT